MKRRKFLAGIGAAAVWPAVLRAQQPGKSATIGLLASSTAAAERPRRVAFVSRLAELGWVDGRNLMIEHRAAQGIIERAGEIGAEFARLKVDAIVLAGDAQGVAVKRAAPDIPVVFAAAGDPVGNGLVANLPRPGGNVTGFSVQLTDTAGKRIELLHEVVPNLRRLGILGNSSNPVVGLEFGAAQSAARTLGVETVRPEFGRAEDVPALEAGDYGQVRAVAYDVVLNGVELGGGSIRIHEPELQAKIFAALGVSEEDQQVMFGHMLRAFRLGAPPHGGIAFGLDRIVMMICGEESIREVMAFPKNNRGIDLMSQSPSEVDEHQLRDLGIKLASEKKSG